MFEIDKEKFGLFLAQLRKEKGWTQKELAERLFLSDKAVSKWERGLSMPDITILTPLAEELGVTVTELLQCQRMEPTAPLNAEKVDELVKKAINLQEEERPKPWKRGQNWAAYLASLLFVLLEVWALLSMGFEPLDIWLELGTLLLLSCVFGAYFWLFALEKLPAYYDENRIGYYVHGGVRINLPGVRFNNSNWPHVRKAARVWCVATPLSLPILFALLHGLAEITGYEQMEPFVRYLLLVYFMTTLFASLYIAAKKYE